jgi:hypothetical protein
MQHEIVDIWGRRKKAAQILFIIARSARSGRTMLNRIGFLLSPSSLSSLDYCGSSLLRKPFPLAFAHHDKPRVVEVWECGK